MRGKLRNFSIFGGEDWPKFPTYLHSESANVPGCCPGEVDGGERSALCEGVRHLGRQIARTGRHDTVDVAVPAPVPRGAPGHLVGSPRHPLVQLEDVDRLRVGGARQEGSTGREGEREDGGRPLEAPPQLVQLGAVPRVEDPDDGPLDAGRGHPGVGPGEGDGGQLALVCRDDDPDCQGAVRVKHLELAGVGVAGVGQETVVGGVAGQGNQTGGVGRGAGDGVDDLHVSDIVDIEALLQTHHQSLNIIYIYTKTTRLD